MTVDDPQDPLPAIEKECRHHCPKYLKELEECTARVEALHASAKPGEEIAAHCTGQYQDFWHCIDHCAAPKLFAVLK
eukprot:CAMPEP_0173392570 /NCGR_PEP_ID=MMETSP1356-20130122/20160_1 /TAXON_ID=77927 ORGANISM="Hemiselmis virescens, Strain PCC157" /NCGR_SAMPLE_ID=MMETSP1356 /ASSEMBLY_ACC=CAM_ASM_000847 /LENGTH=76 /DNA_ID=CAMNT_0014350397 /DNA_START=19 /DNA_END=249 /DNA_ORIENTATION=-